MRLVLLDCTVELFHLSLTQVTEYTPQRCTIMVTTTDGLQGAVSQSDYPLEMLTNCILASTHYSSLFAILDSQRWAGAGRLMCQVTPVR